MQKSKGTIEMDDGTTLQIVNDGGICDGYGGIYKVGEYYCVKLGILDYFLGYNEEEAVENTMENDYDMYGALEIKDKQTNYIKNKMYNFGEIITKTINDIEDEEPHTIRYFPAPDSDEFTMEWCAIAKVSNNGSTYIFSKNKELVSIYKEKEFSCFEESDVIYYSHALADLLRKAGQNGIKIIVGKDNSDKEIIGFKRGENSTMVKFTGEKNKNH